MALIQSLLLPVLLLASTAAPGWLGIRLSDANQPTIGEVVPGSPAAKAGLKVGDKVVKIDGKKVADVQSLIQAVQGKEAGDTISLEVQRRGATKKLRVRLGTRPVEGREVRREPPTKRVRGGAPKVAAGPGYLGVEVEETARGIVVTDLVAGAPAKRGGLRRGDRIQTLNGKRIRDLAGLEQALKTVRANQEVRMTLARGDSTRRVEFKAAPRPGAKPGSETRPGAKGPGRTAPKKRIVKRPKPTKRIAKPKAPSDRFSASLPNALKAAKKANRPVIVVFGAEWCVNCRALKKSLADAKVKSALKGYEKVWIDSDKQSALADKYRVEALPHTLIMTPAGKVVTKLRGYQPPAILVSTLKRGGKSPNLAKRRIPRRGSTQAKKKLKSSKQVKIPAKKWDASVKAKSAPKRAGVFGTRMVTGNKADKAEIQRLREEVARLRAEQKEMKSMLKQILSELKKR